MRTPLNTWRAGGYSYSLRTNDISVELIMSTKFIGLILSPADFVVSKVRIEKGDFIVHTIQVTQGLLYYICTMFIPYFKGRSYGT